MCVPEAMGTSMPISALICTSILDKRQKGAQDVCLDFSALVCTSGENAGAKFKEGGGNTHAHTQHTQVYIKEKRRG